MKWLNQVICTTAMGIKSLPARKGSSLLIIVGMAGVVLVMVSLLSMAKGFEATLQKAGKPDRVLVMSQGSEDESRSRISEQHVFKIKHADGLYNEANKAMAAAETYMSITIPDIKGGNQVQVPIRGVETESFLIRDEISISSGRKFSPGLFEAIVGQSVAKQFGLSIGDHIKSQIAEWTVVGIFSANGNVHESEVWVDNNTLLSVAARDGDSSSVLVKLANENSLAEFKESLRKESELKISVITQLDYYSERSKGFSDIIKTLGYAIAYIMSIGIIFSVLNIMYSSISARSTEIATLRAIGFKRSPIIISMMIECLLLSLLGGTFGGVMAYLLFNGYSFAAADFSTFSQVVFDFRVTHELLITGIKWSCVLGVLGGILPAIGTAKIPVVEALRRT